MDVNSESALSGGDVITSPSVNVSSAPAGGIEHVDDVRSRILASIERLTKPVPPPEAWAFLKPTKSVRRLEGQPGELLAALRAEFSEEQLLTAHVLTQKSDGPSTLSAVLADTTSGLIFIRNADQSLRDIASLSGSLTSTTPEWRNLVSEYHALAGTPAQPLLLAFDVAEMYLFRRLNLKFTSGLGLPGADVRALFGRDPQQLQLRKFRLTIAGWQVASVMNTPSAQIRTRLSRLRAMRTIHGLDPDSVFRIWLPSDKDFPKLRRAIALRDRQLVATAMANSLAKSCYTPTEAEAMLRERDECDYAVAHARLVRTIKGSADFPLVAQAKIDLDKFEKAFRSSVTDKFRRGGSQTDPWLNFLPMLAADLSEAWFTKLQIVRAARAICCGEHPGDDSFDNLLFQERLRIVDAFAKLYRLSPLKKKGCER